MIKRRQNEFWSSAIILNCKPGQGDLVVAIASPVKWSSPNQVRVVRRVYVKPGLHLETFVKHQHQHLKPTSIRSRIPLWPLLQAYINPGTPPGLQSFPFCPFAKALRTPSRSPRRQDAQIGTSVPILASAHISALAQVDYCSVPCFLFLFVNSWPADSLADVASDRDPGTSIYYSIVVWKQCLKTMTNPVGESVFKQKCFKLAFTLLPLLNRQGGTFFSAKNNI